jgi:hypothetical protein
MLSDSLDALLRRLVPAPVPDARMVRLTPIAAADAQDACWHGGSFVGDEIIERRLQDAGISLKRRGGAGKRMLVWARLETRADRDATGISKPQLSFYRVELADPIPAVGDSQWLVEAHCWRRGPDGSIAVYSLSTRRPFQRVFETELETIDDATTAEVAGSMFRQIARELVPLVVQAVRATQGRDPDRRPERDRLS